MIKPIVLLVVLCQLGCGSTPIDDKHFQTSQFKKKKLYVEEVIYSREKERIDTLSYMYIDFDKKEKKIFVDPSLNMKVEFYGNFEKERGTFGIVFTDDPAKTKNEPFVEQHTGDGFKITNFSVMPSGRRVERNFFAIRDSSRLIIDLSKAIKDEHLSGILLEMFKNKRQDTVYQQLIFSDSEELINIANQK